MQITTTTTATPARLADGTWGARTPSTLIAVGQIVRIQTAAGKTWEARVTGIVRRTASETVVTTASLDRAPATARPATSRRRSSTGGCAACTDAEDFGHYGGCARHGGR